MNKIKIIFISLTVLSVALLSSCAKDNNSFAGTVFKIDSTQFGNGATIQLIHDMQVVEEKTAGSNGEYIFENLPEGLYFVEAEIKADTLEGNSRKFYVQAGAKRVSADIILEKGIE